ncbi:caspase-7-like isoform X2 [Brachyhypopomus gauderio]|uniref:caspase-7-like isoform X2 n=1 Tax=Brachyhypopomus gauderio TaxID=698409 RepID=UPI00404388D2
MADEALKRVRTHLKESLTETVIKQLLDDLKDEKVFGDEEVESILQENLQRADRARCMIDSVTKKGPTASCILIDKLQERDKNVYDKLELHKRQTQHTPDSRKPAVGPPPEDEPMNKRVEEKVSSSSRHEIFSPSPRQHEKEEYTMSSEPRGVCVIISNEHFTNPRLNREGSRKDADALEDVFRFLGFKVEVHKDLTAQKMKELMREYSEQQHDGDCWVCCVLSHGNSEGVLGCDVNLCPTEDIFSPFNGKNCPSLLGKPKVFFIQACRGSKRQEKLVISDDAVTPDTEKESYSIPKDSDFLFARSTVYGYEAYQSPEEGSWFIQSLCRHLREGSEGGDDILTVLTRVNDEVSKKEGKVKDKKTRQLYDAKETPISSFTLRKKLIFRKP